MIQLMKKTVDGISQLSSNRRNAKKVAEYHGKGRDLAAYLFSEFGIENIFLTPGSGLEKISFPEATVFESSKIKESHNWVLIYDDAIDNSTQKAVYDCDGMSVSISELITLFEQLPSGKLPLVLNEIGNAYAKIVVCGTSKNAERVYDFYSGLYRAEVRRVFPKELETAMSRNADEVIIIADLLPDLFRLLQLPKTVYIQWQHMVGNTPLTDETFDITERIIPKMLRGGVYVACISVPRLSKVNHHFRVMAAVTPWKVLRNRNFNDFIRKTDQHFHTENLADEHLDVKIRRDKGYAEMFHNGEKVNYDNGLRRTVGGKAYYRKRIFLFGPCIVMGAYVSDENTIPSIMQSKLGEEYLLLNRGQPNAVGLNLLMRSIEFRPGDTVFYFGKDVSVEGCVNYNLVRTYDKIRHLEKHISDSLMHCDSLVNERIATDLTDLYMESFGDKAQTAQNGSITFGAEVKTPPELYMLKNTQFEEYIESIRPFSRGGENGAIVMNCNPFTNGHLFLITEAAKRVDTLYIFVVEEDKSFFPFRDRIELVKQGTAHIKNVCVLNSGQFVISSTTLPGYFEKDQVGDIYLDASNDLMLFLQIARVMNIRVRFAGSEPIDKFTNQYNMNMRTYLERYGVRFVEIEREICEGEVISASSVRACIEKKDFTTIKKIVPGTTYRYLVEKFGKKETANDL